MKANRRSILAAVDHEMGLTRREVVAFSGLAPSSGPGALLRQVLTENPVPTPFIG